MKNIFTLSHISAGFTAVLVGYTSSVVIILQLAEAAGASPAQSQSWLLVLGLIMGLSSIVLSWHYKTPILTAWSTPGAAMLIASVGEYQMPEIISAFFVSGLMVLITGFIKPLQTLLESIPKELATAMLAAILLPFCLASFTTINTSLPIFALMFACFLLTKRFLPNYTMPILLVVGIVAALLSSNGHQLTDINVDISQAYFVVPALEVTAIVNLALPLYVITMLSQNLPGLAMLQSYGFRAPVNAIFIGTGTLNVLAAGFGGFSLNLAAISAAICMTEDVDKNKNQRYKAALWAGVFYLIAGFFAGAVVQLFALFPQDVTRMLAGLALLGTLMICLQTSFVNSNYKEPALFTFLVTLSGVSFMGVNSVLLGLFIGLVYLKVMRWQHKN